MALIPKQINELAEAIDPVEGNSGLEIEVSDGLGGFLNKKIKKSKLGGITEQDVRDTTRVFTKGQANAVVKVTTSAGYGIIDLALGNKFRLSPTKMIENVRLDIVNTNDVTQSIEIYVEECDGYEIEITDEKVIGEKPEDWEGSLLIAVSVWQSAWGVSENNTGTKVFTVYSI